MEQEKLWATFQKTGKVQDYLRYCGIDLHETGENSVKKEKPHETDDRRVDHT
ncbi:MAG: hypothetical protein IJP14_04015 [Clostridia bacterium]|nr:hypothetical protein [Clostridia bacterium]